jgi:5-methylcytosine-specific restriction endonuclease McrA
VYLRDGLACSWCGWSLDEGAPLTLDHLTPRADGGTNATTNLVTACRRCNSTRQDTPAAGFAERFGRNARAIRAHARKDLAPYRVTARAILTERRTVAEYLATRGPLGAGQ